MVHFDSVGKDYGEVTALQNVTFSIPKGGIVGLLGPNGAGKTTTMRIMTGYMEPTRGDVRIAGETFSPDSVELKRRIGYLPESAPMYGDMLAWDYLAYEARLHGVDTGTRVVDVIQEVGLGSHAHKPIRELSKGYRQRVGLAHTLLHDPELLVLDEPTNGLDPNQIVEVRGLIRRIAETKTVILSTHIMQEVEALCERVIVIHNGAIRYDGSIQAFSPSVQAVRLMVHGIDFSDLDTRLRTIPGFRSVERAHDSPAGATGSDDDRLLSVTVYADPGDDPRPHIFRLAAGEGDFTIYEMAQERTSVEALFRELTRDEREGAGDGGEA
ncbi:MAG: ATP-binding cassette domain-containing protein [Spirochaetales bacterium]|nr:ATP-binding cassette domain-containing protein [Spirochaetales bacterium]